MEITRFTHDDVEYIIGADIEEYGGEKVAAPYFRVTSKRSKKKRGKKFPDKAENFFHRIPIKNPIPLYKRIYGIFDDFLTDYNYVSFSAWKDDREKRTRVYRQALEKMGFKLDYHYVCPWDNKFQEYVLCKPGYELKKKEYKKIFRSLYGYWYRDTNGEWTGDI